MPTTSPELHRHARKKRICMVLTTIVMVTLSTAFAAASEMSRPEDRFYPIVETVSHKTGVPAYIILTVMKRESNFDPLIISNAGAVGLMQVMPSTADDVGIPRESLQDPYQNILAGSLYLKKLKTQFGSWGKAFAAYYIGPGRLERNELNREHWKSLGRYLRGISKYLKLYKEYYYAT